VHASLGGTVSEYLPSRDGLGADVVYARAERTLGKLTVAMQVYKGEQAGQSTTGALLSVRTRARAIKKAAASEDDNSSLRRWHDALVAHQAASLMCA